MDKRNRVTIKFNYPCSEEAMERVYGTVLCAGDVSKWADFGNEMALRVLPENLTKVAQALVDEGWLD